MKYKFVFCPGHPGVNSKGYIYEHILVVEKMLGRFLKSEEVVHHIDENKSNNIPNNLIGKKIKTYARVILKISVVILFLGFASTFIYAGIVADEESSFLVYLMVLVVTNIIIVLTFVFSYFSFLLVSGFGAIIEDINAIKNK